MNVWGLEFASHDLCGEVIACHAVAMFHAIGLNFIAWMVSIHRVLAHTIPLICHKTGAGFVMGTFEPASPATAPNPDNVFQGTVDVGASYGFGVPAFLEVCGFVAVVRSRAHLDFRHGPMTRLRSSISKASKES